MKLGIDYDLYFEYLGIEPYELDDWVAFIEFNEGTMVLYKGMVWQKGSWSLSSNLIPDEWLDLDSDGVNDNPWNMLYPWSDGDYITFTVRKRLHDGDSWIVDMSEVGNCSNTMGNINGDEYVNIHDVVKIINAILGKIEFDLFQKCAADLSNNGFIGINDIVSLVNIVMGFDEGLLGSSSTIDPVDISVMSGSLLIESEDAIGGVHLSTQGQFNILATELPDGWKIYSSEDGVILLNMTGKKHEGNISISYAGNLEILTHHASDLYGNELETRIIGLPDNFSLERPYPNPFNPVTTISYNLKESSAIRLVIYDLLGREVEILHEGMKMAGYHHLTWNASGYASGIYFVRLTSDKHIQIQKIVLMK